MTRALEIAYLMEDTDLSGGVRIQLAQADALIERGHHVTIITKGLPLTWRHSRAEWMYVDDFLSVDPEPFDFIIGTFWTTVPAAWQIGEKKAIHLCQGYEGGFTHYVDIKPQIDAVYALPIPKLVVTPHLVEVCRRFTPEVFYVGQIVDDAFFRDAAAAPSDPPRVLLTGASQIDFKGIDVGYGAALHARFSGAEFDLVRVSPWAPSREEPLNHVAEFHVGLSSSDMVKLVHSCDLFIGPSRADEGFGLPAAEAMAARLPTVLTRIPSFLSFDPRHDYALFADEDDAEGLGDALHQLFEDDDVRRAVAARGRQVVEQFRSPNVAVRMENYFFQRLAAQGR